MRQTALESDLYRGSQPPQDFRDVGSMWQAIDGRRSSQEPGMR